MTKPTLGEQIASVWRVDCELHKWRRQGNNFYGTIMNSNNFVLEDGRPYFVDGVSAFKYIVDRGDWFMVVTHGFKFKLPKDKEIK